MESPPSISVIIWPPSPLIPITVRPSENQIQRQASISMSQSFKSTEYSASSDPRLWVLMGFLPGYFDLERRLSTSPSPNSSNFPLTTHMSLTSGSKPVSCQYQKLLHPSYAPIFDQSPSLQSNSNYGADSRTTLPRSSLLVTTPHIDILRPVCFSPNRFSYSCYH